MAPSEPTDEPGPSAADEVGYRELPSAPDDDRGAASRPPLGWGRLVEISLQRPGADVLRFVRTAPSRILGLGGRLGLRPAAAQSRRQHRISLRLGSQEQMEAIVDAEQVLRGHAMTMASMVFAAAALISLSTFFLVGAYFWLSAIAATLKLGAVRCDVPLNKYIWIQFSVWWIMGGIRLRPQDARNETVRIILTICSSSLSVVVLGIGFTWVRTSRTCSKTNPGLFFAIEHLLYFQTVGALLVAALSMTALFFLRWVVRTWFDVLGERQGQLDRSEVVEALPRVPLDSDELLDPEDKCFADCVICSEELSAAVGLEVVRTPCAHYFHKDCLMRWCSNHGSCPICRTDVGGEQAHPEQEGSEEQEAAVWESRGEP